MKRHLHHSAACALAALAGCHHHGDDCDTGGGGGYAGPAAGRSAVPDWARSAIRSGKPSRRTPKRPTSSSTTMNSAATRRELAPGAKRHLEQVAAAARARAVPGRDRTKPHNARAGSSTRPAGKRSSSSSPAWASRNAEERVVVANAFAEGFTGIEAEDSLLQRHPRRRLRRRRRPPLRRHRRHVSVVRHGRSGSDEHACRHQDALATEGHACDSALCHGLLVHGRLAQPVTAVPGCTSSPSNPLGELSSLPSPGRTVKAAEKKTTAKSHPPANGVSRTTEKEQRGQLAVGDSARPRLGEVGRLRQGPQALRRPCASSIPTNLEVAHRLGVVADAQRRHAEAEQMFLSTCSAARAAQCRSARRSGLLLLPAGAADQGRERPD